MAKRTRRRSAAARGGSATAEKTTTTRKRGSANKASSNGKPKASPEQVEKKRAVAAKAQEALIKKVVAARNKDQTWQEIAEANHITPGKAQFMMMLHRVDAGDVPTVPKTGAAIAKARAKADEFSSWGWIAARTGLPEGKVKALAEEAGAYEKGAENIAKIRAGTDGDSGGGKSTGKKTTGGKSRRGRGRK